MKAVANSTGGKLGIFPEEVLLTQGRVTKHTGGQGIYFL